MLDGGALASGALAGHDTLVVADGTAAQLDAAALDAVRTWVLAGGTLVGWRGRGLAVARAAGRHRGDAGGAALGPRLGGTRAGGHRRRARRPPRSRPTTRRSRRDGGRALRRRLGRGDRRPGRRRARAAARLRPRLPGGHAGRDGAAQPPAARQRRCSMMRTESQIASPSSTAAARSADPSAPGPRRGRAGATGPGPSGTRRPACAARARRARTGTGGRSACGSGRGCAISASERPTRSLAVRTPNPASAQQDRLAGARGSRRAARARGTSRSSSAACPRGGRRPAELALGLRRAKRPPQRRRADLGLRDRPARPGAASAARGERERGGQRQLDRRRLDAGQAAEVGEEPVEREVAVAQDVALAEAAALVGEQLARRRRRRRRRCSARRRRRRGSRGAGSGGPARSTSGRTSPAPKVCAGLTITTGSPCAARRSATASASCLAST